ncbi:MULTISPECIES: 5-formyltetrahydrofolate cyclo-ligase [Haematobacter]|uniref:5-formyltetrahydrofolate cyclo-ligase n=1 Tax=Haematobacter TaxID=366614 RepID=UPI0035941AB0
MARVKSAARQLARQRRDGADRGLGLRAAERLRAEIGPPDGHPIAAYLPIGSEIDPLPALSGWPVCLPVVEGRGQPLRFRLWEEGAPLAPGPFGTSHPERGEWVQPRYLVVPLLAFDRGCMRLGYGGGFYDRTLAMLRALHPVRAIGFAFAVQEVPVVPVEDTDAPLDAVVTERETIRRR